MTNTDFSENALVEQPAIALFEELGYEAANCFYEKVGPVNATLGRETTAEVVLVPKLQSAPKTLNPDVAEDAIRLAIEELTRDRSAMSLAQANREIYKLLKDGARVSFQDDDGNEANENSLFRERAAWVRRGP
jgi:type I restriction enzyme, R subunit